MTKIKIMSLALIVLFIMPFAMAEGLFDKDLKATAQSIYFGTLNFFANIFVPVFILLAVIFFVLIVISVFQLLGRLGSHLAR